MLVEVAQETIGREDAEFNGQRISFRAPFRRLSLRPAAAEAAARRLGTSITESDLRQADTARAIAAKLGLELPDSTTAGKAATEIFEALWEHQLIQPTFVYDFPTDVSPLSKQKPDDPDTVERFELYIGGFEVANAFSELNDPIEQRRRFEQQVDERRKGNAEAHVMDEDYVRALEYGLPPTAGEGIGIDRLVMVLTGSPSIREVILFPHMRRRD
jgi:lysyl-tRNA synthetase class 2